MQMNRNIHRFSEFGKRHMPRPSGPQTMTVSVETRGFSVLMNPAVAGFTGASPDASPAAITEDCHG